ITWVGGGANHCPTGFNSVGTGNVFNISGGAIIDTTQEGVHMDANGQATLNGVTVSAGSMNGVPMLNTVELTTPGGKSVSRGGTDIWTDNGSTATLTITTVTMSVADGIVLNGTAMATLNSGATVSLSGADGVILNATAPNLTANAGSTITMNTGNGIDATAG